MSNIREYTKKKAVRKDESLLTKIKKHRLTIFYKSSLAVVLIAAITVVLYIQIKNKVYQDYQVVSSIERKQVVDTMCVNSNGNVLTYSKDGANCVDSKGNVLWNQTYEMQSPIFSECEDVVALGDYNGRTIYVQNALGKMGEIDTKMPIRDFSVSANGVVAAVLDDTNVTWIYLFDSVGNTLAYFKTSMKKSGYPIGVDISENGELVGVSYLYVDSGKLMSSVAFYNFGPVGQNEIDNFVSGYDYADSVVPYIHFMNNETVVAVADNRIMIYKGKQKPTSSAEVLLDSNIQGVYGGDKYIGILYLNTASEEKYRMDIYGEDGKLIEQKNFDMEFSSIFFEKDKLIIHSEKEWLIHKVNGIDSYHGNFKDAVLAVVPTNSANKYTLVTNHSIDVVELK